MTPTPQELGREFERFWAKLFGGSVTPASGARWYSKLDVKTRGMLWSLKFTSFRSFPLTQEVLSEAFEAATGIGSEGVIPALGIRVGSEAFDVVVLRRDDFLAMVREGVSFVEPTRSDVKKARSKVPILLRGGDSQEEE